MCSVHAAHCTLHTAHCIVQCAACSVQCSAVQCSAVQYNVLQVVGFWGKGPDLTLESISRNAKAYEEEGEGDRGKLMQFFNCEHEVYILFNQFNC